MSTTPVPDEVPTVADEPEVRPGGLPLYVWVLLAVALAVPAGRLLGERAAGLEILANLIIRALKALAAPLVVLAILVAIVTNDIRGRQGLRMMLYYLVNTLVAMGFALVLANLVEPGAGASLTAAKGATPIAKKEITDLLYDLVPDSIGAAFVQNNIAQLVVITLALGIGLAKIRDEQRARGRRSHEVVIDFLSVGFELLMRVLLWVVALVPIAVFGVVAARAGQPNFLGLIRSLAWFIVVVLAGLACQVSWYLLLLGVFGRVGPLRFLAGAANVMATTFSTSSTAATMPVTLQALQTRLGVSRESSQLAACVGTNFNNDGTALYQAAAVLFLAQAMGSDLSLIDQAIVVLTTLVASVGAGGIPSGSFVTLPLIFAAIGLRPDLLPVLLTVDWFLDRCRTTSNVLGDMTVAILLDRTADAPKPAPEAP